MLHDPIRDDRINRCSPGELHDGDDLLAIRRAYVAELAKKSALEW